MGPFDGLAGTLNALLGDPVIHTSRAGVARSVQAVVRRVPVEVMPEDGGAILQAAPQMRLPAALAAGIVKGDRIEDGTHVYRVLNRLPTKSPATDRFVVFELEEIAG